MRQWIFLPALVLTAGLAQAQPPVGSNPISQRQFSASGRQAPLVLAQSADAAFRVNQLEDQLRGLSGKIEEMNFIILQLQEQMRKMQEDNEFRFQELEQRQGSARAGGGDIAARANKGGAGEESTAPGSRLQSEQEAGAQLSDGDEIARKIDEGGVRTIDGVEVFEGKEGQPEPGGGKPLGKLVFDGNGNLIDSAIEKPVELVPPGAKEPVAQFDAQAGAGAAAGDEVAALPPGAGGDQLYDLGYTYVQAGDYRLAAQNFSAFVRDYPKHKKIPEARFWLGESLLAQGKNEEAAKVLLETHKKYPKSRLAAQTLLKLGVSLGAMNQRELACATFAEVGKKYPDASTAVRSKVAAEQKAANCKAG